MALTTPLFGGERRYLVQSIGEKGKAVTVFGSSEEASRLVSPGGPKNAKNLKEGS